MLALGLVLAGGGCGMDGWMWLVENMTEWLRKAPREVGRSVGRLLIPRVSIYVSVSNFLLSLL